jgi:hypothetical protein
MGLPLPTTPAAATDLVPEGAPGYLPATSAPAVGDRPMVGLQTLTLAI